MVEDHPASEEALLDDDQSNDVEEPDRLTQQARRERLAEMSERLGELAVQDGDRLVVEAGEPVILHLELDREGVYTLTWWATALTDSAHHRWRDAAAEILREGESIHTSALGGGYLVELERSTRDADAAFNLTQEQEPVERVKQLLATFPDEVAKLPDEPVPEYLVPPEPEVPPLGEVEAPTQEDEDFDTE